MIGPVDEPLLNDTVASLLKRTAERYPEHDAAVFCEPKITWNYDQLSRRVDRFAAGLLALGLYKGDRIGIWSPNRPEWLIAQFATARVGLVLVNINPAYRRAELEYALNKVGAKALITASNFKSSDYIEMLRDLAPELDTATPGGSEAKRLPELRTIIQLGDADGCREPSDSTRSWSAAAAGSAIGLTPYQMPCHRTTRSTFSSHPAPRAAQKAQRSPTAIS